MGLFKKVIGALGLAKDDGRDHEEHEEEEFDEGIRTTHGDRVNIEPIRGAPRRGFSVPVKVAVERPSLGPLLVPCSNRDGGVQGLRWYANRLKIDEDGDVADEFIDHISHNSAHSVEGEPKPLPRIQKYSALPAKIIKQAKVMEQVLTPEGKLAHLVEFNGKKIWV